MGGGRSRSPACSPQVVLLWRDAAAVSLQRSPQRAPQRVRQAQQVTCSICLRGSFLGLWPRARVCSHSSKP